jgi:hypothetical protein
VPKQKRILIKQSQCSECGRRADVEEYSTIDGKRLRMCAQCAIEHFKFRITTPRESETEGVYST